MNLLVVAFIVFLIVRAVNRFIPTAEAPVATEPADVTLLREVRDELRGRA